MNPLGDTFTMRVKGRRGGRPRSALDAVVGHSSSCSGGEQGDADRVRPVLLWTGDPRCYLAVTGGGRLLRDGSVVRPYRLRSVFVKDGLPRRRTNTPLRTYAIPARGSESVLDEALAHRACWVSPPS